MFEEMKRAILWGAIAGGSVILYKVLAHYLNMEWTMFLAIHVLAYVLRKQWEEM